MRFYIKNFSKISFFMLFILLILTGCTANKKVFTPSYTSHKFSADLNKELVVNIGDSLFVSGEYIEGEAIIIGETFNSTLPGSMMIPFPVTINEGIIPLTEIRDDGKYFCADLNQATASFPGLGSVVRKGDCIGIRINEGKLEWVVDNSNYNRGMETIWTRDISEKELETIKFQENTKTPFKIKSLRKIIFDGHYKDVLNFTLEEYFYNNVDKKRFHFDLEKNKPTIVGIKGNIFEIIDVDNVKMKYKWIKFEN